MILWEEESLNDREKIFEFLYDFNPDAAEKTDNLIEAKVENLLEQPLMGVQRDGIRVMRVLHQKQKFPTD
ncbi:TPA: type II toxin-antitoxin system RelE/ParE family toxin [Vibrio parahaemolyticus]|nr:type II toxin-antitoxin system RelE/ParE family toxin [Vibrio parahaemolyticus]ELR9975310.1 type II toxin-antitoxin system RelE/ParE family toxin [Vibrio parahaemolyticus]MBE3740415.1 type II toxin-antitoxin system RelE/ParE family toxin [Vibrio parahaemolyticus]HCG8154088.1 type II toxin-antitoxin system RelE/ParE family toxin [Vibrio parahaemolyticus]